MVTFGRLSKEFERSQVHGKPVTQHVAPPGRIRAERALTGTDLQRAADEAPPRMAADRPLRGGRPWGYMAKAR